MTGNCSFLTEKGTRVCSCARRLESMHFKVFQFSPLGSTSELIYRAGFIPLLFNKSIQEEQEEESAHANEATGDFGRLNFSQGGF